MWASMRRMRRSSSAPVRAEPGVVAILTADDIQLNVPAGRTARIQEVHILLIHALCDAIDYMLLGGE